MKLAVRLTLMLAVLLTACSSNSPATPEAPTQAPSEVREPTLSPTIAPTRLPTVTEAALLNRPVSFRGIEFLSDLSLASEIFGDSIPASLNAQLGIQNPEHIRFSFDGSENPHAFNPREPQLLIYSVQQYRQVSEQIAGARIDLLTELIEQQPELVGYELPVLPVTDAMQLFHVQLKYLDFQNGSGLRFITRFGGEKTAVTNQDLIYTFQGLSSDRKYLVTFFFPLTTSILPDSLDTIPEDQRDFSSTDGYDTYLQTTVAQLDNLNERNFNPDISLLDELVESILLPELTNDMVISRDPERLLSQVQKSGLTALQDFWDEVGVRSPDLFSNTGQISGELFDLTINGGRREYSILIFSDEEKLNWQYLIFHSLGNQWLFLGRVDLPNQQYIPPSYRVVQSVDKRWAWLVIDWLKNSGEDAVFYEQSWYWITDPAMSQVFSFPVEGYSMSHAAEYNVRFQSTIEVIDQVVPQSVQLSYDVSFTIFGDGEGRTKPSEVYDLFNAQHTATYTWDENQSTFVLDADNSTLSDNQLASGFLFSGDGQSFLEFGGDKLIQVARSGTDLQRRWMKSFLEGLDQSTERDHLMSLLGS